MFKPCTELFNFFLVLPCLTFTVLKTENELSSRLNLLHDSRVPVLDRINQEVEETLLQNKCLYFPAGISLVRPTFSVCLPGLIDPIMSMALHTFIFSARSIYYGATVISSWLKLNMGLISWIEFALDPFLSNKSVPTGACHQGC